MSNEVLMKRDDRGVLSITLNRPEIRNAFNDQVIVLLREAIAAIDEKTRAVIEIGIEGRGTAFDAASVPTANCTSDAIALSSGYRTTNDLIP